MDRQVLQVLLVQQVRKVQQEIPAVLQVPLEALVVQEPQDLEVQLVLQVYLDLPVQLVQLVIQVEPQELQVRQDPLAPRVLQAYKV